MMNVGVVGYIVVVFMDIANIMIIAMVMVVVAVVILLLLLMLLIDNSFSKAVILMASGTQHSSCGGRTNPVIERRVHVSYYIA